MGFVGLGPKNFRVSLGWVGLGWVSLSNKQIRLLNWRTVVTAPLIHSIE